MAEKCFFLREYDEYPVSIIVSISSCSFHKMVLEEVREKRELKGILGLESKQLHSSLLIRCCETKHILEWLHIRTKSS